MSYKKEYYEQNREHLLVLGREWREKNKERMDYLNKRNYDLNGDAIRAKVKEWAKDNPDAVKAHNLVKWKIKNGELQPKDVC